jgi:hypothetical protein
MKLIFVYNVDNDPLSLILDGAHKVFSPSTYTCDLCEVTYSNIGERRVWKKYRKESPVAFEFIYKNQMHKRFQIEAECPLILSLTVEGAKPGVFLSSSEFKQIKTPEQLIEAINQKLG